MVKGIGDGEVCSERKGERDDASGIRLTVTGGSIGARGTVSYVTGFADQLKDTLSTFLNGDTSLLSVRQQGLEQDKEDIATDRSDLDSRISAMEARLKSQFLYNDAIIQKLTNTQDFVKQQFDVLNASRDEAGDQPIKKGAKLPFLICICISWLQQIRTVAAVGCVHESSVWQLDHSSRNR